MSLLNLKRRIEKSEINWQNLIEGGIFEFLHRTILTDIKPPVFHKMMEEKEANPQ